MSSRISSRPRLLSLEPNSLADIWSDIKRVAQACGAENEGETLVQQLQAHLLQVRERTLTGNRRPRVACLEWLEPLMACGNWMPELVEMAGGVNLFGQAGRHSPWMTWEQLAAADPDVIVVMSCGFDLERTRQEMCWLTRRPEWTSLKAVQNARVYLTDGNQYFNRSGPRLVDSLQILAEVLHPERIHPTLQGSCWQTFEPN